MASRMRVTSLTATVIGCPTWIRTRTKASKGPCATVTPSDKPHKTVASNGKSAMKKFLHFCTDWSTSIELSIAAVFQPQRGGMFIDVEQWKFPAPLGDMPPRWGLFTFRRSSQKHAPPNRGCAAETPGSSD